MATTPREKDREAIHLALKHDCGVYVGDEYNVFDRVYQAAWLYNVNVIVRITQDCPLIDPAIIDKTIALVLNGHDFAASRLNPQAYPDGMDVDVFTTRVFRLAWQLSTTDYSPEHISEPMKDNPLVSKGALPMTEYGAIGDIRLTLDTPEDYAVIKNIYDFYQGKDFGFEDIMRDFYNWKTMVTRVTLPDPYLHKVGVAPPSRMKPKSFDTAELDMRDKNADNS